jgi:hypothetical protein
MDTNQQNQPLDQNLAQNQSPDVSSKVNKQNDLNEKIPPPPPVQQLGKQSPSVDIPKSSSSKKVFIIMAIILVSLLVIGAAVYFLVLPNLPRPALPQ